MMIPVSGGSMMPRVPGQDDSDDFGCKARVKEKTVGVV
jgi:hypothetical protein